MAPNMSVTAGGGGDDDYHHHNTPDVEMSRSEFEEEEAASADDMVDVDLHGAATNADSDDAEPEAAPESFVDEDIRALKGSVTADSSTAASAPPPPRPGLLGGQQPFQHALTLGTDQRSLEDRAHCLSQWFLSFLSPLLKLGASKVIEPEDVGVPSDQDRAGPIFRDAHRLWAEELERVRILNVKGKERHLAKVSKLTGEKKRKAKPYKPREPNVARVLAKGYGRFKIVTALCFYILSAILAFAPVLLLEDLVKFFESGADTATYDGIAHPWVEVVGLAVLPAIISLLQTRSQVLFQHLAIYVRTAVSTLLYEKSLGVSAAGRAATSTGQVVNMMSNDTTQLQRFLQFGGMTLVSPLQIIVALALIYQQVGHATWVGVAFMLCLMPVNVVVFSIVGKQRRKVLKFSDLRVKTMNEILAGIRIIKFYAWERPFGVEVGKVRENELRALTKLAYTSAIGFSLILLSAPIVQPILVFLTYINIQDGPLTASTAFTTVALFNIMRFPFAFLPMGMLQFIQSRISLRRLGKYLRLPELEPYVVSSGPPPAHHRPKLLEDDDDEDEGEWNAAKTKKAAAAASAAATATTAAAAAGGEAGAISMRDCSFSWSSPDGAVAPLEDRNAGRKRGSGAGGRRRSSAGSAGGGGGSEGGGGEEGGGGGGRRLSRALSFSNRRRSSASLGNTGHSVASGLSVATDVESTAPDPVTLKDISCTIEAGSLVAVVGEVGSGKSSLLSAILGEMEPLDGSRVYMPRDDGAATKGGGSGKKTAARDRTNFVSYCSQTPWVVNDTLRGNVLFGRPYRPARYQAVVKACALADDLAVLPAGDMTEIGERGINLSGGQKARVSLARALYSADARVLLLDDPLSAVDAHVGEHLFREAIADGGISEGATRVLVTHHVHFLPRCDKVIVMKGGRIGHMGSYQELVEGGVDFAGAVDVSKAEGAVEEEGEEEEGGGGKDDEEEGEEEENAEAAANSKSGEEKAGGEKGDKDREEQGNKDSDGSGNDKKEEEEHTAAMKKKGATLVEREEREEGSVSGSKYLHYARAGGLCYFLSVFFIQGLGRGAEIMASFWLAIWAEESVSAVMGGVPLSDERTTWYLNIYALFGILGVVCLTVRAILMAVHRLHASRNLHENSVTSVLRAPVAFFDVTPTGRVLGRFAADMDKVDLDLTQSIGQGFSTVYSVLGALGAIVAATRGTFLIPLMPISYVYYIVQKWFRRTSTELQRVTSVAISPIFADFSQVLSGTSTIRAYDGQDRFFAKCQRSFDNFNASYNLQQMCNFWLGLRLDILGGLIGAFIGGIAVATASSNFIPAGWLGLALSYSIEVTGFLKHGVRMIAQVEADMNSVERILYYSEKIDSEAPAEVPGKDPQSSEWPSKGTIEIRNASMRYRDGPLVLKDITLTVRGGEKIGVVGRTGSGKSSLMNLLFRITEPEKDGGKIYIDGVDISEIGTEALRLNLSIIPQDPIMFSNTVRYNLDPFGTSTDQQLWDVLSKVQLSEVIAALPLGLEDQVSEGGENFSQGQRQLLCIARSLLRNPKILVMDEATASIDNATDAMIQKMIRENFGDATVLTIAHRLGTIMDSDRVLVLDDGRIAEFDSPEALLQKTEGGIFSAMVAKSRAAHGDDVDDEE